MKDKLRNMTILHMDRKYIDIYLESIILTYEREIVNIRTLVELSNIKLRVYIELLDN